MLHGHARHQVIPMSYSDALHQIIQKYNVLQNPTKEINLFFRRHPEMYKVALLANHLFRAIAIGAAFELLPFGKPMNIAFCFATSLFYRLSVETNCAYKFALPAFAGSITFPLALAATKKIVEGVAFASFKAFALTSLSFVPLALYVTYIVLTVNYDVDHR